MCNMLMTTMKKQINNSYLNSQQAKEINEGNVIIQKPIVNPYASHMLPQSDDTNLINNRIGLENSDIKKNQLSNDNLLRIKSSATNTANTTNATNLKQSHAWIYNNPDVKTYDLTLLVPVDDKNYSLFEKLKTTNTTKTINTNTNPNTTNRSFKHQNWSNDTIFEYPVPIIIEKTNKSDLVPQNMEHFTVPQLSSRNNTVSRPTPSKPTIGRPTISRPMTNNQTHSKPLIPPTNINSNTKPNNHNNHDNHNNHNNHNDHKHNVGYKNDNNYFGTNTGYTNWYYDWYYGLGNWYYGLGNGWLNPNAVYNNYLNSYYSNSYLYHPFTKYYNWYDYYNRLPFDLSKSILPVYIQQDESSEEHFTERKIEIPKNYKMVRFNVIEVKRQKNCPITQMIKKILFSLIIATIIYHLLLYINNNK